MKIKGMVFPDGELIIYTDYRRSENAGAGGCFQIVNICIDGETEESILQKVDIDQGFHYHSIQEVLSDLQVDPSVSYREEIV